MSDSPVTLVKQHLIDPEVCIRCNTCEETCPVDAITHDGRNYVVDPAICNACNACISPCPTGSIDNWRVVAKAYSLEEQFSWSELPPQQEVQRLTEVRRLFGAGGALDLLGCEVHRERVACNDQIDHIGDGVDMAPALAKIAE